MLETVRIRRAGYNVRLTYDEFIQLYRILLPKGLLSTQKDVRDFMDHMDLNKQHYQLGTTKIYMRESQKMCLDYKLHMKIIDSIVKIQRWFKARIQRDKFIAWRSAATRIQSWWRMHSAQIQLYRLKMRLNAAILIQSTFRMFRERRAYQKLRQGVVIVQSHVRGKLARIRYKRNVRQKAMKERYKLRPTQSLPLDDRSPVESHNSVDDISRSYPKLAQYSMDLQGDMSGTDNRSTIKANLIRPTLAAATALTAAATALTAATCSASSSSALPASESLIKAEQKMRAMSLAARGTNDEYISITDGATQSTKAIESRKMSEEVVDSRTSRAYNFDYATKQYFDDSAKR